MDRLICLGRFLSPHGVDGHIKIQSWTENPQNIFTYEKLSLKSGKSLIFKDPQRFSENIFLVFVEDINTREDLKLLSGKKIWITRNALPPTQEEEFYQEDLVGLKVLDEEKTLLGQVSGVFNFGADDLLAIILEDSKATQTLAGPFSDKPDKNKKVPILDKNCQAVKENLLINFESHTDKTLSKDSLSRRNRKNTDKQSKKLSFFIPFKESLIGEVSISEGFLTISSEGELFLL